jgi:hypothetical protein
MFLIHERHFPVAVRAFLTIRHPKTKAVLSDFNEQKSVVQRSPSLLSSSTAKRLACNPAIASAMACPSLERGARGK